MQKIFIHIPKTGGCSIRNMIIDNADFDCLYYNFHPTPPQVITDLGTQHWNQLFKFTVIRNVFERFVSAYYFMFKSVPDISKHPFGYEKQLVTSYRDIHHFLKECLVIPHLIHFRPQCRWFTHGMDKVFLTETMTQDFATHFGIPITHDNKWPHPAYTEVLYEHEIQQLTEIYKEDIKLVQHYREVNNALNKV